MKMMLTKVNIDKPIAKGYKKKSKGGNTRMEMCYAGALVMPSSYVFINEEEMRYVEGGAKKLIKTLSPTQCNRLAAAACIAGGLVTALCGMATIVSAVAAAMSCGTLTAATAICAGITTVAAGMTATVSGYLWMASTYKGLNIYYDKKKVKLSVAIKK